MAVADFEVSCICGVVHTGRRRRRLQTLACSCGRRVAVLPYVPLPRSLTGQTAEAFTWPWWWQPALAAIITLGVVTVMLVGVVRWLALSLPDRPKPARTPARSWSVEATAARRALGQGAVLRAATALEAALAAEPPAQERRGLEQLQRQVSLLADLLHETPDEIALIAAQTPADEWPGLFHRRYEGRAMILDTVMRRDALGQVRIDDPGDALESMVRFDLEKLSILQGLPLTTARRVVVGFRLGEWQRDGRGWVLRPQADSGVLVTDPAVLAASALPPVPDDPELLDRQLNWLERR